MSILNDITLGQYYPVDSFVHRLDPRTKLIVILVGMTILLLVNKIALMVIVFLLLLVTIKVARLPLKLLLGNLKPFIWLFLITFFIHLFITENSGTVNLPVLNIPVNKLGAIAGISYSLRLAVLIILAALLTLTTSPVEMTDALENLFSPLKKMKIPVHDLIMMMTLSLRFVPTLLMEADKLRKAQISRGVSFQGNIFQKVKNVVPFILPLFLSVFRRADELALAMDARCYTGGEGRTRYKELSFGRNDYFLFAGAAVLIIVFIISR
jgi:energy-coupling factor transport system permease protein